ncbi:MAG: hypothetical protein QMB62_03435 [Oscillospiraceae bacterium]
MNNEKTALEIANSKKRIFDQMASMHFKLSDEYKRLASIEDAVEIFVSVVLCGITFLDFQKYFDIAIEKSTLIIGYISIFLLAFTLIKQRLGHKQLCEKHQIAGKMYSHAKLNIVSKITEWNAEPVPVEEIIKYIDDHFSSLNELPQIPERHFNRLKHLHQSKVEMSKFLDSHRNDYWLICIIKFRFCQNAKKKALDDKVV